MIHGCWQHSVHRKYVSETDKASRCAGLYLLNICWSARACTFVTTTIFPHMGPIATDTQHDIIMPFKEDFWRRVTGTAILRPETDLRSETTILSNTHKQCHFAVIKCWIFTKKHANLKKILSVLILTCSIGNDHIQLNFLLLSKLVLLACVKFTLQIPGSPQHK